MGWVTRASDDFQRPDENPLAAPWVNSDPVVKIYANTVQMTIRYHPTISQYGGLGTLGTDKQFAQADLLYVSAGMNNMMGAAVRCDGTYLAGKGYSFVGNLAWATTRFLRVDNNVATQLGSDIPITPSGGNDAIRTEADGSTIRGYFRGSLLGTQTDSTYGEGGIGMFIGLNNFTYPRLDNWSGGDWEADAAPSRRPAPIMMLRPFSSPRRTEV